MVRSVLRAGAVYVQFFLSERELCIANFNLHSKSKQTLSLASNGYNHNLRLQSVGKQNGLLRLKRA